MTVLTPEALEILIVCVLFFLFGFAYGIWPSLRDGQPITKKDIDEALFSAGASSVFAYLVFKLAQDVSGA